MTIDELRKKYRQIRREKHITQLKIFEKTGISNVTQGRWEHGAGIRLDTLIILLDAIGCDLEVNDRGQVDSEQ